MRCRRARLLQATARVLLAAGLAQLAAHGSVSNAAEDAFDHRRSSHFVLYQDTNTAHRTGEYGSKNFDREVLLSLEAAHERLAKLLDLSPRRSITVVIYDPQVFDRDFAAVLPFPVAGFYLGVIRVRGFARITPELERVLNHEYVHAAFDGVAPSLILPALLNEGIAEWFARATTGGAGLGPGEARWLLNAAADGSLPHLEALLDSNFGQLSANDAAGAYITSTAFVLFLARHGGDGGLRELCRTLLRTGSLDRAFERAYGRSLAELDEEFRSELVR